MPKSDGFNLGETERMMTFFGVPFHRCNLSIGKTIEQGSSSGKPEVCFTGAGRSC
jgi:hypothetical protein